MSTARVAPIRAVPTVDELVADPAAAWDLTREQARDLLPGVAALQAVLNAKITEPLPPVPPAPPPQADRSDVWLTARQVAERLNLSLKAVYNREWSFRVRTDGMRMARYSACLLREWQRENQP
jgi:hypothetical protein